MDSVHATAKCMQPNSIPLLTREGFGHGVEGGGGGGAELAQGGGVLGIAGEIGPFARVLGDVVEFLLIGAVAELLGA